MSDLAGLLWRRCATKDGSTVFRRLLGAGERQFYWDTISNDMTITISHMELESEPGYGHQLFSKRNVELAWIRMKQRFPLLAASVDELPGSEAVEFVLDEASLTYIRPGEVAFVDHLDSTEDVTRLIDNLRNGPPVLTKEIIAKVYLGPKKDAPQTCHALVVVAHVIMGGMSGITIMRELCQELASLSKVDHYIREPLEERLTGLVPAELLSPNINLSLPKRRWRLAGAKVIYQLKQSRTKGGHTIPTTTAMELGVPALSRTVMLRLPASQTKQIVDRCRARGITIGNALPVLNQLAQTRVLLKSRGKKPNKRFPTSSNVEWDNQRMQPMYFPGPMSLRPHLDRAWHGSGGASNGHVAFGLYDFTLPLMPAPKAPGQEDFSAFDSAIVQPQSLARWLASPRDVYCYLSDDPETVSGKPWDAYGIDDNGSPSFSSLLSSQQFLSCVRMVRGQSEALAKHPLLHELQATRMDKLCPQAPEVALARRAKQADQAGVTWGAGCAPSTQTQSKRGRYKMSNGRVYLGNKEAQLPLGYPLPSAETGSTGAHLHIRDYIIHLRCQPGELYLGALTTNAHLTFFAYVDAHVYDMNLVQEWLEDVGAAAIHYLGDPRAINSNAYPDSRSRSSEGHDLRRARL